MLDVIHNVKNEGLSPLLYHKDKIEILMNEIDFQNKENRAKTFAKIDLLLTDAFFLIGTHYSIGLYDPYKNQAIIFRQNRTVDHSHPKDVAPVGGQVPGRREPVDRGKRDVQT